MAGGSAGRPSLPRISWPSPRRRLPESIERFPAGNPPPRVHPMLMLVLNVLFVLVAISMIALILMQRGSGAQAGTGFGGGASATVFGSRGSSNFLSKATKWLAIVFFARSEEHTSELQSLMRISFAVS